MAERLIYEMATRRMLFGRFEVRIHGRRSSDRPGASRSTRRDTRPAVEVKGATYTALRVAREDGGWVAQCVVDV